MYELRKHGSVGKVKDAWISLYGRSSTLSPYQEYHYCSVVEQYPLMLKRHRLKNVVYELCEPGGRTVMLLPLHLRKSAGVTIAYLWGEFSRSAHLDFVYGDEVAPETFMAALDLVARDLGKVSFALNRIQAGSRLNEAIQNGGTPWSSPPDKVVRCVHIPLAESFDAYLGSLSKNTHHYLRNNRNHLKADGKRHEVRTFLNQPIPRETLVRLFRLHEKRYREKGNGRGVARFLPVPWFIRLNPTIMALGELANAFCSILYIEGDVAAFCAGFSCRDNKVLLPFFAIDSDFSRYAPGGLLITETVMELIERGYRYLDLSRGGERYKFMYGGVEHYNYHYQLAAL